ncbi:hypothetical protein [Thiomicrorhabdus sp.]|uniref:hypothetical protein n=1 Tax=Thiomicrorhabdus sp. TaxID=2039724 RepID=UPI002AA85804|nr:hypothetical protein [Thiomicrorhabdus sp.]
MKIIIADLAGLVSLQNEENTLKIKDSLNQCIENYSDDFVQDMSHISQAANYTGNMRVDAVIHIKDNLYRCDYSYDWAIAWTCSGTQEAGRVKEKVRFTLSPNGELEFKFLKFDS